MNDQTRNFLFSFKFFWHSVPPADFPDLPDDFVYSSKDIAEFLKVFLEFPEYEKTALFRTMIEYFELEEECRPKRYRKSHLRRLIIWTRKAVRDGTTIYYLNWFLNRNIAFRRGLRRKKIIA